MAKEIWNDRIKQYAARRSSDDRWSAMDDKENVFKVERSGQMPNCRSCGAEIKFIKLKSGKWNPVDPTKRTMIEGAGKEVLVTELGEVVHGTFASIDEGANRSGYISHFATCPNANQHRSRKGVNK